MTEKKKKKPRIGIRGGLMLYLSAFVAVIVAMLWVFQIVFLNDFYSMHKKNELMSAAETIQSNINETELQTLADQLAERYETCIMVIRRDGTVMVNADAHRMCMIHRMRNRELAWWCRTASENGEPHIETMIIDQSMEEFDKPFPFFDRSKKAPKRKGQSIMYVQQVERNGENGWLLLNMMVTPVDATVTALRTQLTIITVIIIVLAMLMAWLMSRHFSMPLIQTNQAAEQLSAARYTRPLHASDYREIDELNTTLENAAEELGKVEHLQHELIANVSHDLRTPLTMIGGYAELMRDIPDEMTAENLQNIIDETARLNTLVNELLDFSRMEAGSSELSCADMSITETIMEITDRCGAMVKKEGYIIRFQPQENIVIHADRKRMEQVLYNLINNALTYTGEDKTVTIEQHVENGYVRISIRDSGKGIPQDELPLIWNRYYRAKENHRRAIRGSGLGLSIVRTILEKHGDKYGVDSKEGEGTCFWFETAIVRSDSEEK